jgi:hypothetical protein
MKVAELYAAIAFVGCAGAAGAVAASEDAGMSTALFGIAGLGVGAVFALVVHRLAYWLLDVGTQQTRVTAAWGMAFAYMLFPLAVALGAIVATIWLTSLVVEHLL